MTATILVAGVIFSVCLVARWIEGSWIAPAAFFPAVWAGLVAAYAILFPQLDEYYAGSMWILSCCVAFLLGTVVARGRVRRGDPYEIQALDRRSQLPWLLGLVLLTNLVGVVEVAYLFLRRHANPFSATDVISVVLANRAGDYGWAEPTQQPMEWLAFLLSYTGALFGGVLSRLAHSWWETGAGLLSVVLISLEFALYGSRFGVLYGGSFWLAANLAAATWLGASPQASARRLVRVGTLAVIPLAGASLAIQFVRHDQTVVGTSWRSMVADGFSFLGAFSIWFRDHGLVWSDLAWGARSLTKLVGVVGIREAPFQATIVDYTYSNIYTVFRDVLEDFGVVGAVLLFGTLGYWGRWASLKVSEGRLRAVPLLVLIYAFILSSFATSIFFYTAPTAALAVFATYCLAVAPSPHRAAE